MYTCRFLCPSYSFEFEWVLCPRRNWSGAQGRLWVAPGDPNSPEYEVRLSVSVYGGAGTLHSFGVFGFSPWHSHTFHMLWPRPLLKYSEFNGSVCFHLSSKFQWLLFFYYLIILTYKSVNGRDIQNIWEGIQETASYPDNEKTWQISRLWNDLYLLWGWWNIRHCTLCAFLPRDSSGHVTYPGGWSLWVQLTLSFNLSCNLLQVCRKFNSCHLKKKDRHEN